MTLMEEFKREMEHRGMTVEEMVAEKVGKYNDFTLVQIQRLVDNGASPARIASFQNARMLGAVEYAADLRFHLSEEE